MASDFDACLAIKELCSRHSKDGSNQHLKTLSSYTNKLVWSPNQRQAILNTLGSLIIFSDDDQLISDVATCFNPLMLELLVRASSIVGETHDGSHDLNIKFFITLSKLIGRYYDATQFAYRHFEGKPDELNAYVTWLSNEKYPNSNHRGSILVDLLLAAYRYLCFDPAWFSTAFNWSFLIDIISLSAKEKQETFFDVQQLQEIKFLAIRCFALTNKLTTQETKKLILDVINVKHDSGLHEYTQRYSSISSSFTPLILSRSQSRLGQQSTEPSQDIQRRQKFSARDFSPELVEVSGILLFRDPPSKSNSAPSPSLFSATDDSIILIEHFRHCLHQAALSISLGEALLIEGPIGVGKTSLVDYLAKSVGRFEYPRLTKLQLGDQIESRQLIGSHVCTEIPGEFQWKPGPLTQAITCGHWLVLEDIDLASSDILAIVSSVIKNRSLQFGPVNVARVHPDFRLIMTRRIATRSLSHDASLSLTTTFKSMVDKISHIIRIDPLDSNQLLKLIVAKWPILEPISDRILTIYESINSQQREILGLKRPISQRDLFKWCSRISKYFQLKPSKDKQASLADQSMSKLCFKDAIDCLTDSTVDINIRKALWNIVGVQFNLSNTESEFYASKDRPNVNFASKSMEEESCINIGRVTLKKYDRRDFVPIVPYFAPTLQSLLLLEKIATAVSNSEPVLLVGETGIGKTSSIQYLAHLLNQKLIVINMSQQSESSDLLGGYKPVSLRDMIAPLKVLFDKLFHDSFDVNKNAKFLTHITNCVQSERWPELFALMKHVRKNAYSKHDLKDEVRQGWTELSEKISHYQRIIDKKMCLSFAYIEGSLLKAMKEGFWVLLDEINMAEPEALQSLATLLDQNSQENMVMISQEDISIKRHPHFRIFGSMNPATDVGKRELPVGIRNRFTEFYVPDVLSESDLHTLVSCYISKLNVRSTTIDSIVKFYTITREESKNSLSDTNNSKPVYSLRTLCRGLMVAATNPCGNIDRSLYEAISLSFFTQLNRSSRARVQALITELILNGKVDKLRQPIPKPPTGDYIEVEGYWISKGALDPYKDELYILTDTVRHNLKDIARIISLGHSFPILIQGETSVGKTSLIQWIAQYTGNVCVRINNHEHTDIQEYVGSYCADADGRLVFKEGPLLQAMRNGWWIILDELNLAPTEVLEALNRVLDDNREYFLAETNQTIRANSSFRLFATQNPPGLYAGRKVLSRAFRNRFVELHFDTIPAKELEEILQKKCTMPPSYSKKMVNVFQELQLRRRESGVFAGKHGFATLRDLFRWGERYRLFREGEGSHLTLYDWDMYLAIEGFYLLSGRVRKEQEERIVQEIIEKTFKRSLKSEEMFGDEPLHKELGIELSGLPSGFEHIVWTKELRRLGILLFRALKYKEPVLLVGETGCGKTTMCHLYAALRKSEIYTVQCHMHCESADFLGSLRPARDKSSAQLFQWIDGPLVLAMHGGDVFLADEISLADDSVIERLNSVLEPERKLLLAEKGFDDTTEIITAKDGFKFVATMNPGGDFGKKELSPALRNRFTEIWCPSTTDSEDLKLIIAHNLSNNLTNLKEKISQKICEFLQWLSPHLFTTHTWTPSIRDILAWVQFINSTTDPGKALRQLPVADAVKHGAQLVFIDSIGVSNLYSSLIDVPYIRRCCHEQLEKLFSDLDEPEMIDLTMESGDVKPFGFEPFFIESATENSSLEKLNFIFQAPGVVSNATKVLRAMQVHKPILLEGPPGVGKTSLITALAKASGHQIVRINLSEQTDVSDLFGADLPSGQTFTWCDGPLLRALKSESTWIMLDEMNLASQSVLEGLNSCLDHRGEIYIAELGKTFKVRKGVTRIFACQNPYSQGGDRKGLPKSFLNRFSIIYVESLTDADLNFIVSNSFPNLNQELISKMVQFNQEIATQVQVEGRWGRIGYPWEFNLRDLFRWCELMAHDKNLNPSAYFEILYGHRMRASEDRRMMSKQFLSIFNDYPLENYWHQQFWITSSSVQFGSSIIQRKSDSLYSSLTGSLQLLHDQIPMLSLISKALEMNWVPLIVGPSGVGKSSMIQLFALLAGQKLDVMIVDSETDAIEILGGFHQQDILRLVADASSKIAIQIQSTIRRLISCKSPKAIKEVKPILDKWHRFASLTDDLRKVEELIGMIEMISIINTQQTIENHACLQEIKAELAEISSKLQNSPGHLLGGSFEWIDSVLVKALKEGRWLLIEDVNLCPASVLDRLNSLLEPNGTLSLTEQGAVKGHIEEVKPHANFRLFFTMDPKNGELSRAMRNRTVELCLNPEKLNMRDFIVLLRSKGLDDTNALACHIERLKSIVKAENYLPESLIGSYLLKDIRHCSTYSYQQESAYGSSNDDPLMALVSYHSALDARSFIIDPIYSRTRQYRNFIQAHPTDTTYAALSIKLLLELASPSDILFTIDALQDIHPHVMSKFDLKQISELLLSQDHMKSTSALPCDASELPFDLRFNNEVWRLLNSLDETASNHISLFNRWLLNLFWGTLTSLRSLDIPLTVPSPSTTVVEFVGRMKRREISSNLIPFASECDMEHVIELMTSRLMTSILHEGTFDNSNMIELPHIMLSIDKLLRSAHMSVPLREVASQFESLRIVWSFLYKSLKVVLGADAGLVEIINAMMGFHQDAPNEDVKIETVNQLLCDLRLCKDAQEAKILSAISSHSQFILKPENWRDGQVLALLAQMADLLQSKSSLDALHKEMTALKLYESKPLVGGAEEKSNEIQDGSDQDSDMEVDDEEKSQYQEQRFLLHPLLHYYTFLHEFHFLLSNSKIDVQLALMNNQPSFLVDPLSQVLRCIGVAGELDLNSKKSQLQGLFLHPLHLHQLRMIVQGTRCITDSSLHELLSLAMSDLLRYFEDETVLRCLGLLQESEMGDRRLLSGNDISILFSALMTLTNSQLANYEVNFANLETKRRQISFAIESIKNDYLLSTNLQYRDLRYAIKSLVLSWTNIIRSTPLWQQDDYKNLISKLDSFIASMESENYNAIGSMICLVGMLTCDLFEPPSLDPIERTKMDAELTTNEISFHTKDQQVRDEFSTYIFGKSWVDCFSHPLFGEAQTNRLHDLSVKYDKLNLKCAYRPSLAEYPKMKAEVNQFKSTIYSKEKIFSSIETLSSENSSSKAASTAVKHSLITSRSIQNFDQHLSTNYPLFTDQLILYSLGLKWTSLGLIMMADETSRRSTKSKVQALVQKDNHYDLNNFMIELFSEVANIQPLQRVNLILDKKTLGLFEQLLSSSRSGVNPNINRLMMALIYQLILQMKLQNSNFGPESEELCLLMEAIMGYFVRIWRETEDRLEAMEKEKESLIHIRLDEEELKGENHCMLLSRWFPNYEWDEEGCRIEMTSGDQMRNDQPTTVDERFARLISSEEIVELYHNYQRVIGLSHEPVNLIHSMSSSRRIFFGILSEIIQTPTGLTIMDASFDTKFVDDSLNLLSSTGKLGQIKDHRALENIDIYFEAHPVRSAEAMEILDHILKRINEELLPEFPRQPGLLRIKRAIKKIKELPVTCPYMQLITGLQMIFEVAQDWESVAPSSIKLAPQLQKLVNLIFEARRLELKQWSNCLDSVSRKIEAKFIEKWFLHVYSTIEAGYSNPNRESSQALAQNVSTAIIQFIENSALSDFSLRLRCIECIQHHFTMRKRYQNTLFNEVISNLLRFHQQFLPQIEKQKSTIRDPLETEVKEYVKISYWKDTNYYAIKSTVSKSRTTIHKVMQRFESSITQPCRELFILSSNEFDLSEDNTSSMTDSKIELVRLKSVKFPSLAEKHEASIVIIGENSIWNRLNTFHAKATRIHKSLINGFSKTYSTVISSFYELSNDVSNEAKQLRNLRVDPTIKEKDDWVKQMHSIQNRKRNALNRLFKHVAGDIGISYRKGLLVAEEIASRPALMIKSRQLCNILRNTSLDPSLRTAIQGCDASYNRVLWLFVQLSANLQLNPSKDLSYEALERIKGISSQLVNQLIVDRKQVSQGLKQYDRMISHFQPLSLHKEDRIVGIKSRKQQFSSCQLVPVKQIAAWIHTFNDLRVRLKKSLLCAKQFIADIISVDDVKENDIDAIMDKVDQTILGNGIPFIENRLIFFNFLEDIFAATQPITPILSEINSVLTKLRYKPGTNTCFAVLETVSRQLMSHLDFFTQLIKSHRSEPYDQPNLDQAFIQKANTTCDQLLKSVLIGLQKAKAFSDEMVTFINNDTQTGDIPLYKQIDPTKALKTMNIKPIDIRMRQLLSLINDQDQLGLEQLKFLGDKINAIREFLLVYERSLDLIFYKILNGLQSQTTFAETLVHLFNTLVSKGFCQPPNPFDAKKESGDIKDRKFEFEDDAVGFEEGAEGKNNVSEKIESEAQLDELKMKEEEKKEEEEKTPGQEEEGIEMSDDFDAEQNPEEKEGEDDKKGEDEDEEEEELDDKMGDVDGEDEDILDEKLWNDDEDEGEGSDEDDLREKKDSQKGQEEEKQNIGAHQEDDELGNNEGEKDFEELTAEMNDEYEDEKQDPYKEKKTDQPQDLPDDLDLEDIGDDNEDEETGSLDQDVSDKDITDDENIEDGSENADESQEKEDLNLSEGEEEENPEGEDHEDNEASVEEQNEETPDDSVKEKRENLSLEDKKEFDPSAQLAPQQNTQTSLEEQIGEAPPPEGKDEGNGTAERDETNTEMGSVSRNNPQPISDPDQGNSSRPDGRKKTERSLADEVNRPLKRRRILDATKSKDEKQQPQESQETPESMLQHVPENEEAKLQAMDFTSEDDPQAKKLDGDEGKEDKDKSEDKALVETHRDDKMISEIDEADEDKGSATKMNPANVSNKMQEKRSNESEKLKDATENDEPMDMEGDFISTDYVSRGPTSEFHTQYSLLKPTHDPLREGRQDEFLQLTSMLEHLTTTPDEELQKLWNECERSVAQHVHQLCEQLEMILIPTKMTKLKGDYRTGKRLNLRKVIAFIASHYRKDKIWLRRLRPHKRQYQIVVAIDDSSSMSDNQSKILAFQSLALLTKSLSIIEAGQVAIVSFGEQVKYLHPLAEPFTEAVGAKLMKELTFNQNFTRVTDMLNFSHALFNNSMLSARKSSGADISQLLLILSDGRGLFQGQGGTEPVRQAVSNLQELGVFTVFIILDNQPATEEENKGSKRLSILDLRSCGFDSITGKVVFEPYLQKFPFPFYIILKDISAMPHILAEALRQWFELLSTN